MSRIIGIDPGSRKIGIGIIENNSLLYAKVLRLDLEQELPSRIQELSRLLQDILTEFKPEQAVLEDVFVGEHARSALILGQARGAVLAILGLANLPVTSIAPRKVKQTITGQGAASKQQVGEMIRILLKLDKKPAEDAADALALALSYGLGSTQLATTKRLNTKQKRSALEAIAQAQGKL